MGLLSGLAAGIGVLLFRWLIEEGQALFLPGHQVGNYEALPVWERLITPVFGGLALGFVFSRLDPAQRQVGIAHVIDRLHSERDSPVRLPLPNLLAQFFGGIAAIVFGHSVDREGPGVHVGAGITSQAGQILGNSAEESFILAACGAAAAIAAAFNTPLAGVVFVIEVLRVRYRVERYLPIIIAAVTGAVLSQLIYGPMPAFDIPPLHIGRLAELPLMIGLGLLTGITSSLFVGLIRRTAQVTARWSPLLAFPLAGLVTGLLAIEAPQIMGISYDSLEAMLRGELVFQALLLIILAKLLATGLSVGLRVPGGLIGPAFVIGGGLGAATHFLADGWLMPLASSPSFYALVGMAAMMGASLRAPLAALTALLELTWNPGIILPGMIAVISAELTNSLLLGQDSVFTALLKVQGSEAAHQTRT
ncbi:MAG: chloride channel protein [Gammaproteobacteria bacterium]|nr:MAG: chloride channel protein [Gammaproteobacteria bacterium]